MLRLKENFPPLLNLAIPLVLTGLLQSAVWFFETLFLAQLGPDILAAGSLVSWLFGTVLVILLGTLSAINIVIAHKHGATDEQGILLVIRDGFWLASLVAAPVVLLFWNMSPIFLLFGQNQSVVLLAKTYLHAIAWGVLPNVIMIALLEVFMGLGRTRPILIINILSVSLTIFFSFMLIFGQFGLPALRIAGAGWGQTISNWITAVLVGSYLLVNDDYKHYFRFVLKPTKRSYFLELLHVGAPMGLMYCVEVAFFFALTLIMGSLGSLMLAANQIVLQYLSVLIAVIFSIAQAITVRMGHLLGANDKISAEQTAYIGIFCSSALMVIVAFCYYLFPSYLISLDFDIHKPENLPIVSVVTHLLMINAIFQLFESIRISLFGTLRALKDTRFTLYISVISFWVIALPVGYFLATRMQWGAPGLWWGMVLGAAFSVFLLLWRFKYKINHYS